ncbi:hypothetical protein [Candidatus Neptunichlamydia sp. REUL1]|nr:hypothetical protein [Candidatus Neptunochlamydia sp. REUL1]
MILRLENRVEREITFEMLEGMADHMRRVVQVTLPRKSGRI